MIISRRVPGRFVYRRTSGIYGHLPGKDRKKWPGYLRLVTQKNLYTFWYHGNPFRGKIFEKCPNRLPLKDKDE